MRITFLGHQGWQIENNKGRSFLLDPILEAIGNGKDRMPVWPPRRLDLAAIAPIDAVIISHEHSDHFSLETLNEIPRRCRIYISDLASSAMFNAIKALGFSVERFTALSTVIINGIKVTPLPGLFNTLEPDVYGLLLRDDSGASFLTGIDTVAHPDIVSWLAQNCPQRTIDNLTNNFIEPRQPLVSDPAAYTKSRSLVASTTMEFVQKFQPKRAVISGQGWCFNADRDQYNHSFFSVDNEWLLHAACELAPQVEWLLGKPGLCCDLHGDQVTVSNVTIATLLPTVDRRFDATAALATEPFNAWTGIDSIDEERLSQVYRFIREDYGQCLGSCAPKLMEGLYYLKCQDCGQFTPTLHLVLRNGAQKYIYEFDYGLLQFCDITSTVQHEAVVGFEMWASDLELLIDAAEESFLINETAVRSWSHLPRIIDTSALIECFMWFTPRFRPKETLKFYLSKISALRAPQTHR